MTKIGVQVLEGGWGGLAKEQVPEYYRRTAAPVFKTMDFDRGRLEAIREASPETLIVGRAYSSTWDKRGFDSEKEAKSAAGKYWREVLGPTAAGTIGLVDAWEGPNECNQSGAGLSYYAYFEAERARILDDAGWRAVLGNFSTGTPDYPDWPRFYPAIAAAVQYGGYIGLHEYSAPRATWMFGQAQWDWKNSRPYPPGKCPREEDMGDTGHLTGRYRVFWRSMPAGLRLARLIISECLIDGGVQPRWGGQGGGWQDFCDPEELVADLAWYDGLLTADDWVMGATIFHAGAGDNRWAGFNVAGEALELMGQTFRKSADFAGAIRAAAGDKQLVRLNPVASLQRAILRDGFLPISSEFGALDLRYVAQLAQDPRTMARRVYYCPAGRWSEVAFVDD